ncbi:MAG: SHOCT domain-containing protein [Alphaproteobacteria bacterium]|nr:SHOCT domain-containing protein [Alphaproteobacteria bacterium]
MAWFLILTMAVLCIVFLIFVIQIPIFIAKGRGISGSDLSTIIVLSWLGIFLGVTWLVALILSLVWPRGAQQVGGCKGCGAAGDIAEQLDKLHKLKKKGIISQKEFDSEKKKLLG